MLWAVFTLLLVLWAVGLISGFTLGNFVHVLFIAAVVILVVQIYSARRPTPKRE